MRRKVVGVLERGACVYWVLSCGHNFKLSEGTHIKPKTMVCAQCVGGAR